MMGCLARLFGHSTVPPAPPDPRAFFDALIKARLGDNYGETDRYRDFRAVFLGQSGPEQGNRVLWQILEWTRIYQRVAAPGDPHETYFRDGERNVGLRVLVTLNVEPERHERAKGEPHGG
jgi:hypothetical protein